MGPNIILSKRYWTNSMNIVNTKTALKAIRYLYFISFRVLNLTYSKTIVPSIGNFSHFIFFSNRKPQPVDPQLDNTR